MAGQGETTATLRWIGAHILGAGLLAWITLANGFPLLFFDSGTYLRTGTELYFSIDRPVSYGLAIAPLHRLSGLWAVAGAQTLLATWLIGLVVAAVLRHRSVPALLIVTAGLAIGSSLPWFVGQIMPDLFAGLLPLIVFLLVFSQKGMSRGRFVLLTLLLCLIVAFHLSFVAIAAGLVGVAGVAAWALRLGRPAAIGAIAAVVGVIAAILGLCLLNFIGDGQFRPALMSDSFLVARLLDDRLAQRTLARACAEDDRPLCRARPLVDDPRESLPGQAYLWNPRSPRGALLAADAAALHRDEADIVRRTLREQPGAMLRLAVTSWGRQLVTARAADGMMAFPADTQVAEQIGRHFGAAAGVWQASLQQQGRLPALAIMPDRLFALIAAILAPFILAAALRRGDRQLAGLAVTAIAGILLNAAICGILSGVFDRYQSRVLWLLPLVLLIAGCREWERRRDRQTA